MKYWGLTILLVIAAAGCRQERVQDSLWQQINQLSDDNTELSLEVETLRRENLRLQEQVHTLAAIDRDVRLEGLTGPERVGIGRHTGLFDKAGSDGLPDTLVVYLQPIDAAEDTIKAAGRAQVELWNLAAPSPDQAGLKTWTFEARQLKELWGRGLFGAYYRLVCPLEDALTGDETELTVRVTFTDYLTGRVLTDQKVITK